ncbi:sacsin N-terminal ATP-binding-like domain-containing protein [Neomicrococcus lactis]|uniref:sacsin N-terminal ATP-binding-like domain-containing protein n=1 Tax=Neomicrococcus lactis TaxID=732241 RepID=UPI002300A9CB|nr:hypothetical protein [Neomicrococcus lactis]
MTSLTELTALRRSYIEAARANGFEEGLRRLLADLYPDNAHFIYELLQNAEDAGAREVSFELRADGLKFEHDGNRAFTLTDIDSITGIAQSTKADDATSIGKFGVGFKAVFAYTRTPRVQSGMHSFVIEDLFVPTPIPRAEQRPELTTFWFPFDREEKPAERAITEVEKALREISDSTLLFLKNIRLIAATFPNGEERMLERTEVDENVIEINSADEEAGPSYWYRITGELPVSDKPFPIAAAFALVDTSSPKVTTSEGNKTHKTSKPRFEIVPIDGKVFIYFPAVKETSGLKFHIHAPFASTVARDSVRDDADNEQLILGLSHLIANSIPKMSAAGLITDGFLSAVPNNFDDLPERYHPIREQIIEKFELEPVTPVLGGGYAPSSKLIRSISTIRSALKPSDVDILMSIAYDESEITSEGWLPDRDGRSREFISSLSAIEFGLNGITDLFDRLVEIQDQFETWGEEAPDELSETDLRHFAHWDSWLRSKDDESLRAFYVSLGRLLQQVNNGYSETKSKRPWPSSDLSLSIVSVPLVRIQAEIGVDHVVGNEAFLPEESGQVATNLVLDTLLPVFENATKAQVSEAKVLREFYEAARVKIWNAAAQLESRVSAYSTRPPIIDEAHLNDLTELSALLDSSSISSQKGRGFRVFLGEKLNGSFEWVNASDLYIDTPFEETGLQALYGSPLFEGKRRLRLAAAYEQTELDVSALALSLGATRNLRVKQIPIWTNPRFNNDWRFHNNETKHRIATDWCIDNFKAIVETYNEQLLHNLWSMIITAERDKTTAVYRANGTSLSHYLISTMVDELSSTAWILDRDGNLRPPADMTVEDLAAGWEYLQNSPMLAAIGFGSKAAQQLHEAQADDEAAKKVGFQSAKDLQIALRAFKKDPARVSAIGEELGEGDLLPESPSMDPVRRASHAREAANQAPERKYEVRNRRVRVQEPGYKSAARGYLILLYSNEEERMFCQICDQVLPFKVKDQYYFEAVQFVGDAKQDFQHNRLALCPTCAAKYRHARTTTYEDLRDDLLTQTVEGLGNISIEVVLAGEKQSIRFVGKHAIDIQATLESEETPPVMIDYDELDTLLEDFSSDWH